MRVLESASRRYDVGIRLLSFGRIENVYEQVAQLARGPDVLDVGCGTGNVTLRLAQRGLRVTAVDLDPDMLDVARKKVSASFNVRWIRTSAVELIDHFPAAAFDTITSVLLFSELSQAEQREALRQYHHLLRPGGQLIVADECAPQKLARRAVYTLLRWPLAVLTYLLTQTSTNPVRDLEGKVGEAGFQTILDQRNRFGDFVLIEAQKQEGANAAAA